MIINEAWPPESAGGGSPEAVALSGTRINNLYDRMADIFAVGEETGDTVRMELLTGEAFTVKRVTVRTLETPTPQAIADTARGAAQTALANSGAASPAQPEAPKKPLYAYIVNLPSSPDTPNEYMQAIVTPKQPPVDGKRAKFGAQIRFRTEGETNTAMQVQDQDLFDAFEQTESMLSLGIPVSAETANASAIMGEQSQVMGEETQTASAAVERLLKAQGLAQEHFKLRKEELHFGVITIDRDHSLPIVRVIIRPQANNFLIASVYIESSPYETELDRIDIGGYYTDEGILFPRATFYAFGEPIEEMPGHRKLIPVGLDRKQRQEVYQAIDAQLNPTFMYLRDETQPDEA